MASSYVSERVRETLEGGLPDTVRDQLQLDRAKRVVDTMSQLKGAAMKVGQQLAMYADSLELSPEVKDVLSALHAEAEPTPFPRIQAILEEELDAPLADIFAELEPIPLGTASLAQAHAGRLHDGTSIVVKVLHDGVDASVATDLAALRALMTGTRVMRRSKHELDELFDEIRLRLEEELDYLQEAANLYAFHQIYGADPRVRIPRVHASYSTERVLTMDRLPGVPIESFVATASQEARQRAGRTLTELYYEQVFHHRMLHADPHPGNFLFEPDGRVGVLDFGCVKRLDEFWISAYATAALAILEDDKDAALAACVDLGSWSGDDPDAGDALWGFLQGIGIAFRSGEVTLGSESERYLEDMVPRVRRLTRFPQVEAPRHVLMLHRSLGGLYSLSRLLGTRLDFGVELREHASHAIARAEGRS